MNLRFLSALGKNCATLPEEETMSNTQQDRAKVAGGEDHEVKYEAGSTGASKS